MPWPGGDQPRRSLRVSDGVRAFVGCLLDLGASRRLADTARNTRRAATGLGWKASWVPPPNLHLTVRFLGELDPGLLSPVGDAVAAVARETELPKLILGTLGAFPDTTAPRVLFVDLRRGRELLTELRGRLDARLEDLGIPRETKPFSPHITLARVKEAPTAFGALPPGGVDGLQATLSDLTLWRSDLTRAGAEHHVLTRIPFGTPRPAPTPEGQRMSPRGG